MKKAQSNYLRNKYRKDGGVRGEDGGASIEEPILYDESKLADTLVDWVSKLKANKLKKKEPILFFDIMIYVYMNYMHAFLLKCRIIYLPLLQILVLVYYFLKLRQDLMR